MSVWKTERGALLLLLGVSALLLLLGLGSRDLWGARNPLGEHRRADAAKR